ncbi:CapA family protein [Akkermansiaceae bacterium]|nr:CapA family protein [Akkermansiaceae bacterium]
MELKFRRSLRKFEVANMKICFTGDVFLGGDLLEKESEELVLSDFFNNADVRIINLEQPISENTYFENKGNLFTGPSVLHKLEDLNVDVANLANNHIHDKGVLGIKETVSHLSSIGIESFGAGENLSRSGKEKFLTEEIAVLGYCDYDKRDLSKVEVASASKAGVNPLRLSKIESDLNRLPKNTKAILYFHWGIEHVWLPRREEIDLAKKLLENDRVITIIGMHSHRIQGMITHSSKKAYMCLGNFIFPNFYISPPAQLSYPNMVEKKGVTCETRLYHKVYKLTYKKWPWINRVSLLINFCTESYTIKHTFVVQDDNSSKVRELSGLGLYFFKIWFFFLSITYTFPRIIYSTLSISHQIQSFLFSQVRVQLFYLRQLGIRAFCKSLKGKIRKKLGNKALDERDNQKTI